MPTPPPDPKIIYLTCIYCQINQHEECVVRVKSIVPGVKVVCDCDHEPDVQEKEED